ncbi:MAG TPA: tetratricopeptide repeat protein [Allosphingosinicella sp.]|jgi:TolA-binding protein|nr:tetratricopeptide repeat protein [Allosphingosinicella sp.]
MRLHLLTALILAGVSMPAIAQKAPVDRRVDKLEQEMRAVQRRVFPGGNIEPEIRQPVEPAVLGGVPAGSAVSDLNARVDALEAQLATLTGQIEQNGFRTRQLEEALNRFRTDSEARLAQIEAARLAPAPVAAAQVQEPAKVASSEPVTTAAASPSGAAADAGEQAYLVGFRLWEQGKFGEAHAALEAMAKKYPKHARASYARNLAGRALLDDGKAATAAKILLSNYQINPKGERAADSLLFLGEALMKLNKPAEACQVYNELQDVYAPTMRDFIKQRLPKARAEAKCS